MDELLRSCMGSFFCASDLKWSECFVFSYPDLKPIQSINAHPSNCICIKFDPTGKYFATGSADALVSLWDVEELVCVRCFSRSVRVSFSPNHLPSEKRLDESGIFIFLLLTLQTGLASEDAELQQWWEDVGLRVWGSFHWHRRGGNRSVTMTADI